MRAALLVHGVELAVRVRPGELESLVLRRYGVHLGAVRDPDLDVLLERARSDEEDGEVRAVDIRAGTPALELAVIDGATTDAVLSGLLAPMVVRQGGLLLRARLEADRIDLRRRDDFDELLLVHLDHGRWRATTTAFSIDGTRHSRRAPVHHLVLDSVDVEVGDVVRGAVVLGGASAACRSIAMDLAAQLSTSVPCVIA
jgi:hypothetical protein